MVAKGYCNIIIKNPYHYEHQDSKKSKKIMAED